ncbi:MAG: DUF1508 domain-containing protein [Gammaproteobacteria bacterium]|nr:DUF1508 domain-containing protein [Gammaproteobacteria bacterium]
MPATFELKRDDDNQFCFHLLDGTGAVLLLSGQYDSKTDAEEAIKEVRVGTLMSTQIAASRTPTGETFFVVRNSHGRIIVKSQLFNNKMLFDNALHQVKDNACVAEVTDLT